MTRTPPCWLLCPERPDEAGVVRIEVADYLLQALPGMALVLRKIGPAAGRYVVHPAAVRAALRISSDVPTCPTFTLLALLGWFQQTPSVTLPMPVA